MRPTPAPLRRVLWAAGLALVVVATAVALPSEADREGSLVRVYDASRAAAAESRPHPHRAAAGDGHGHDHNDPSTKNAISRGGETTQDAQDPTTAAERAANAAYVARNRAATASPELTTAPATHRAPARPRTIFAMAGGCYDLAGTPIRFQATDLGWYLLYTKEGGFLGADGVATEPSESTDWRAVRSGDQFTFRLKDKSWLVAGDDGFGSGEEPTPFRLAGTTGCPRYPESQIGISGKPFAGATPFQEVRGYVDAHTHGMAFEFLGGGAHCGKPWDRYGAPYALVDCPDHETGTNPLEAALSGEPNHDPVGWPTFVDWPAPESLTHEGTYYKWMERSWRGGQRLFVNLLVENNQLCMIYPFGPGGSPEKNSCDDMDSIRLQAQRMRQFQDYIDAQWGGPGKGWYRIVTSPWEAREVINAGKMAIIMGIETSLPFGCTFTATPAGDEPACSAESIDEQLAEVHKMGVRQMELVNKFDNALSGVTGDGGEIGVIVNNAQFNETQSYWDMRHCEPEHPDAHDKNQYAAPEIDAQQQDALFGAIGQAFGPMKIGPLYPPPDHCNERGLTDLGAHLVDALAEKGVLIDPDHMSVKARNSLLDQAEELGYSGVMSSHSWSTEDAYPRIYEMGGYIAPYAGDSTGFVEKWRKHLGWADDRYYFGFGYGADMNGLGAQGDPRGADVPNPVTYPFTGLGGITVNKQRAGERVYDINADGVAQYGLYPDWIQDLRMVADSQEGDGAAIVEDMARGAEAYLQTWERAMGIAPDSCRNPGLRQPWTKVQGLLDRGMTTRQVMNAVGQPYTRLGHRFTFCAKTSGDPEVTVSVRFSDRGRVLSVARQG